MSGLFLEHANIGYRNHAVLLDVCFELQAGEVVLVQGENGSGKTTFVKSLLSSIPVLKGRYLNNFSRTAYLAQHTDFDPLFPFTLYDLVAMGISGEYTVNPWQRLRNRQRVKEQVHSFLHRVGLGSDADRQFSKASGGQLQRALIARCFIATPQLVIMDEPFSHLDAQGRCMLEEMIVEKNASESLTLLIIDHSATRAGFYTRRVVIDQGKIYEAEH